MARVNLLLPLTIAALSVSLGCAGGDSDSGAPVNLTSSDGGCSGDGRCSGGNECSDSDCTPPSYGQPSIMVGNVLIDHADRCSGELKGKLVIKNQSGGDSTYAKIQSVELDVWSLLPGGKTQPQDEECWFTGVDAVNYTLSPHEEKWFPFTCRLHLPVDCWANETKIQAFVTVFNRNQEFSNTGTFKYGGDGGYPGDDGCSGDGCSGGDGDPGDDGCSGDGCSGDDGHAGDDGCSGDGCPGNDGCSEFECPPPTYGQPSIVVGNVLIDYADRCSDELRGKLIIKNQSGGDSTYAKIAGVEIDVWSLLPGGKTQFQDEQCWFTSDDAVGYNLSPHQEKWFPFTCKLDPKVDCWANETKIQAFVTVFNRNQEFSNTGTFKYE
jgi:hypothetical protein